MPKNYHRLELRLGKDVRDGLRRLCAELDRQGVPNTKQTRVAEEILRQFLFDEGYLASKT